MSKVCVIGGGASGLMCAFASAKNGNQTILLEKNEKLGKKIYITGKGRCNITNDILPDEFLENVVHGKKFLIGSVYSFSPKKVMDFFEEYGLSIKVERGSRVFPTSDHASDVTKTLEKACKSVGVEIRLNETVEFIKTQKTDENEDIVVGVQTQNGFIDCDYVVVCTGGKSYPTTGSTGDGYKFAKMLGHNVTDLKPALCGLNLKGDFYKSLQGLSLKNVSLSAYSKNKLIYNSFGEMLFTHFGISGPLVLSLSSLINRENLNDITLYLDLKPALDEEMLDKRILRDFEKYKNKQISNALIELLPQKLISVILKNAKIDERKNVNVLTKEERSSLIKSLKNYPMFISSLRDFSEAIVTSGGVNLSEINPKDMSSKKVKGLKFCGEVLDLDAFTGGFNLQIAFSTGYIAGNTIK